MKIGVGNILAGYCNPIAITLFAFTLFPLFPGYLPSNFLVNISFLLASFLLVVLPGKDFKQIIPVLVFYFILQVLLILSWSNDIFLGRGHMSDIPSLLRPVMLGLGVTFFFFMFSKRDDLFKDLEKVFGALVVVTLAASLVENGQGWLSEIFRFAYKETDKFMLAEAGITFYNLSYYAAFVYFFYFVFFLSCVAHRPRLKYYILLIASFYLLLNANSKPFIVAAPIAVLFLFFTKSRSIFSKFIIPVFFILVIVSASFYVSVIKEFMIEYSYATKGLVRMYENPESLGSFQVRKEQVLSYFNSSLDRLGFGVGLARTNEFMLESHLASLFYRYGLIGSLVYLFYIVTCFLYAKSEYKKSSEEGDKILALSFMTWSALLPITLASSLMIEVSKMAVYSCAFLALPFYLKSKRKVVLDSSICRYKDVAKVKA